MEPQRIAPIPPPRALQRATGERRRGSGGGAFERAFREQHEPAGASAQPDDAEAVDSAPRELQPEKPVIRKDQHRGDRQIDVVV